MKIRSVRPEFFTDAKMPLLSPSARLLYIGLWCIADDEGRGEYLPKLIEGAVFPHEQVDVFALLAELIDLDRVVTYEVDGQMYFHIPRFEDYQKPNRKYESRLPAPPTQCAGSVDAVRGPESADSPVTIEESGSAVREQRVRSASAHAGAGEGEGAGEGDGEAAGESAADLKTIQLAVAYEHADRRIAEGYQAESRDAFAHHLKKTDAAVAAEARRRFLGQTPMAGNVRELLNRIGKPIDEAREA